MKKTIKKNILIVFIAVAAIVLGVLGLSLRPTESKITAEAASTSVTDVNITADKTIAGPGDTIKFTVKITSSGLSNDMLWFAVSFWISPLDANGVPSYDYSKYFSLDTNYGDDNCGYTANILEYSEEYGDYVYSYIDTSNYQANSSTKEQNGFLISLSLLGDYPMEASEAIEFSYWIKVSSDAPNLGNIKFGVYQSTFSTVNYIDENRSTSSVVTHYVNSGLNTCNSVTLRIGTISSDATLKSLEVGHTSATNVVTVDDSMTYGDAETGSTIKIKPTVNDSAATIKYCVGATATPTLDMTSGAETTINLDSSGETTVKFLVTAENGATKTYTLVIKSSYARLERLAVEVKRPTDAPAVTGVGLQSTFDKDTENYSVRVTGDYTSVEVAPTILAGYGATGVEVTATNCTSSVATVSSGTAVITNIQDNATLALKVTAKDGTTSKTYTLTFTVVDVDTSISSLTMTEQTTGATVANDAAKATANGVDYYFLLSEESGFQGTFNLTLGSNASSATVDGVAFSPTTVRTAKTYSVVVSAEAGNTQTYSVTVAKNLKPGYIKDLKYAIGSGVASDVISDLNIAHDDATNTYTLTKEYDPTAYPVSTPFTLTGIASEGATITATNITAGSGKWTKQLALGTNEFSLKAETTGVGYTEYKFVIKLLEKKNGITALTIKQGTTDISGFTFSPTIYSYNITVPFKDYDFINLAATSDGNYTAVVAEVSGVEYDFTHTSGTTEHTFSQVPLTAGVTTTIKVYAIADNKLGDSGLEYTFNITRAAADTSAQLQSLAVTVNGVSVPFAEGAFNPASNTWNVEISSEGATSAALGITATAQSDKATVKIGSGNSATQTATFSDTFTFSQTGTNESKSYSIVVTPEEGTANTYTLKITKKVPAPEFKELSVSYGDENYVPILGQFDSDTGTYSVTQYTSDVSVNSQVYFKGTATSEATISKSTNLTGTASPWYGTLAFGDNTFTFTVTANGASKQYTIKIKLIEDKCDIENVKITLNGADVDGSFSFSKGTTVYNLWVPYKGYETVSMTATTNGVYTVIVDDTNSEDFISAAGTNTHTIGISLTPGKTNTITIHAVADSKLTGSREGTSYTFNITREAPDGNAKLQSLEVTVDGTPLYEFDDYVTFDPDTLIYTYTIPYTGNATAAIGISAVTQSDKATVTGTGSKTFTFGTVTRTETYTVTVTPESGADYKLEYKVNIKRVVLAGDFSDIEISTDGGYYTSVIADFDPTTKTQTINYNVSNVPVGTSFHVKVTLNSPDAKVSTATGLSKVGDEYTGALSKFGLNTFKITASSNTGTSAYTINVNLFEDIDDISDIAITDGTNAIEGFVFYLGQTDYNITVPFTVSSVTVGVTPEGKYTAVYGGGTKLTLNGTVYEKKVTLAAGSTTTLVVYGVANDGNGMSYDKTVTGTKYTLNFQREAADASTTLEQLSLKIDGKEVEYADVVVFDPNVNEYVVEIEKEGAANTASLVFTAIPTVDTSTVKCDSALMSGTTVTKTFAFQNNREHETTYTFTVTAQSGVTNIYTVTVKRIIKKGDFETLEIALTGSTFEDVFTSAYYDMYDMVYTANLSLDSVAEGSTIRIRAVATSGATVTATGFTTASATNNVWTGKLEHGANQFTLTASSATGEAVYKFVINLYESKNTIESIAVTADGTPLATDIFSFNKSQTNYRFTVPYTVNSLKLKVTTDGSYVTVTDEEGNAFAKPTTGTGRNHERTIELSAGRVTTLLFRAQSDKGDDGEWYEFEITRENANSDASLKSLSVTVGGKPVAFGEGEFNPERLDYTVLVEEGSSYVVNISAEATVSSTTVTGTGSKTFNLSDSNATQTYTVTATAEDGTSRAYNITISQKPVVLDGNYDITRIVINGTKDYYDDVPASYNDPVKINVPYADSKVKVVVTTAGVKTKVEITPALTKSGYLDLPEGETVTLVIYAVAEDGTNSAGIDAYVFEITRNALGEVTGPDTTVTISDGNDEESFDFEIDSAAPVVKVLRAYAYSVDRLDINVELIYGGTYEIVRIGEDGGITEVSATDCGRGKKVRLEYGENVFCVNIQSSDGHSQKSAIFVIERGKPTLDGLSALEIPELRQDFVRDPERDEYSYSVASDVNSLTLDVDYDRELFIYDIEGADNLSYGMNKVVISIYEKNSGRASATPIRTITLNVFREESNLFWFIMFWVLLALAVVELIIIIILMVRKNSGNTLDDPEIIVASAPANAVQSVQPIIVQPTQTAYVPPQDNGQY